MGEGSIVCGSCGSRTVGGLQWENVCHAPHPPDSLKIILPTDCEPAAMMSAPVGRWHRITKASDLTTGDLVAWLTPPGVQNGNTGHVMVVRAPVTVNTCPGGTEV